MDCVDIMPLRSISGTRADACKFRIRKVQPRIMEYGLQGAFIAQIASAEITPKSDFSNMRTIYIQ